MIAAPHCVSTIATVMVYAISNLERLKARVLVMLDGTEQLAKVCTKKNGGERGERERDVL